MCCNCKERVLIICMATWTLIQSLGYAVLAILGILVYECEMTMESDQLSYLWYLIYFRRAACGTVQWNLLGLNIPNTVQPIWPDVTDVAYRANIMVILYLALSLAWMITSVGLIFAVLTSCIGRCYYYSSLVSWSVVAILLLLLDCAGIGIFVYDLVHLTGFSEMLDFLQISNYQILIDAAGDFSAPFYLPSLLMMIIAARGFLLWAFNIAIIVLVTRLGSRIGRRIPKSVENNPRPTPYEYGRDINRNAPYPQENVPNGMHPMSSAVQQNNAQPYGLVHRHNANNNNNNNHNNNNNNYVNNNNDGYNYSQTDSKDNEHMPRIVPAIARNSSPSNRNSNPHSPNHPYDNQRPPPYPVKRTIQSDGTSQNSSPTPRSSESSRMSSPNRQTKVPPETPPKPILKVRNTPPNNIVPDNSSDRSDRNSFQGPSDGARSHMLWSYTSNPVEFSKLKRSFDALREDEDLPPVPVPDYTLHFPKNARPGIENR